MTTADFTKEFNHNLDKYFEAMYMRDSVNTLKIKRYFDLKMKKLSAENRSIDFHYNRSLKMNEPEKYYQLRNHTNTFIA